MKSFKKKFKKAKELQIGDRIQIFARIRPISEIELTPTKVIIRIRTFESLILGFALIEFKLDYDEEIQIKNSLV